MALIPAAVSLLSYAQEVESLAALQRRLLVQFAHGQPRGPLHEELGSLNAGAIPPRQGGAQPRRDA